MLQCKYVVGDEKSKAFGCAKVVLNNLHPGEIDSLNCRAFEIPACKGVQFVNHRDCIAELFALDKEIVTFKSFGELREKLHHFLGRCEQAAGIGGSRLSPSHCPAHLQPPTDLAYSRSVGVISFTMSTADTSATDSVTVAAICSNN